MFNQTNNEYHFKYLITAITGEGIKKVYLPDQPDDSKILFKKENKFVRPELPDYLKKEIKIWRNHVASGNNSYISPHAKAIKEWEDTEWERSTNGIWFWNDSEATYITGFYYWFLTSWQMYFGFGDYRDTDKEITYFLLYCEEDPECFGLLLNTIRRYGKSSIMGGWSVYRTTRNYGHYCGMQGEKDDKIAKFYNQMIKKPFLKLQWFNTPLYDTSSQLTTEIKFEKPIKRGKNALIVDDDEDEQLESLLNYMPSGEAEYDGQILHTYLCEEPGKCHPAGTKVRMFDGSIKTIEKVKIGDYLRGDDNTPRKVLNTGFGYGKIYKVSTTRKAKHWYVNEHHILSCKLSRPWKWKGIKYKKGDVVNISVEEYLALTWHFQRHLVCYRVAVEYPHVEHKIDPYFLGIWLGDGCRWNSSVCSQDPEIIEWLHSYALRNGRFCKKIKNKEEGKIGVFILSGGSDKLRTLLRKENLFRNKHIPKDYLIDSRQNRLELLAGLIDTDGHRECRESRPNQRSYEIVQKLKVIADAIVELCLSLGFYASIKEKIATMKRADGTMYRCPVYRVSIYGQDLHEIPCRVERKKMPSRFTTYNSKDPKIYGFTLEYDRLDYYYGFNISGNRLYLLDDYTVTHNTLTCNIHERWKIVKPCLRKGRQIRGKAFMGTTVEFMDTSGKGGKAYKKLFYESDVDDRGADGRTKSGLYACFLSGDCAYEGYFDDHGRPLKDRARAALLLEREAVENDPKDYSDLIRKYPLSVSEIFYINTVNCEFNAKVLQDRVAEIDASLEPMFSKFDLVWENNKPFTKVVPRHNPSSGWFKAAWLPTDPEKECNKVVTKYFAGKEFYGPGNDNKVATGFDPIDHGIIMEDKAKGADDEFVNTKRSRPVMTIKLKFDSKIEGFVPNQAELEARAQKGRLENGIWVLDDKGRKYQYKTEKYIAMMDTRPNDPNVLYMRCLMICWYFGVSLHVESQKPGVINFFKANNCGDFILNKYIPIEGKKSNTNDEGTPASPLMISEYTNLLMTYVEYFGHTIPFKDICIDLLQFKPNKTREHDYTVSTGFCELACIIKPKVPEKDYMDLEQLMPVFDNMGNVMN